MLWFLLDAVTVIANFNMDGVKGTITFSQQSPATITMINVSLAGLDQYPTEQFPWHVHNYPFRTRPDFCSFESVGDHFDPTMAISQMNYSLLCAANDSMCEVGDLSGKFGRLNSTSMIVVTFNDSYLPLYGVHSIVGRSVVIHRGDGSRWVCANIEYPSDVTVAYSPFRNVLVGNIYFIQPYMPMDLTTVFTKLSNISGSLSSVGHNWHVHERAIGESGNCTEGGPHYNPREILVSSPTYQVYCNPSNQTSCEIGDLTGKSSQLDFIDGRTVSLYTDIELPLRVNNRGESIAGRSVVVHSSNGGDPRIACASIVGYNPRTAAARFQEDRVSGQIIFHQVSPFSPTTVTVELSGLSSRASGYHVHDFPVDETVPGTGKCANSFAGGHFNPRNVVQDSSSPMTFDGYEIGDLSGKYGSLAGQDSISVNYSDPYLPLFGVDSIVGRSIVIHYPNGSRWLCANIQYDMDTVSVTLEITSGTLQGRLVLTQLADDPFSETKIFLDVDYTGPPVTVISSPSMSSTPNQVSTSAMSTTSMSSSMTVTSSSAMQSSSASLSPSLMSTTSTVMPPSSTSSMFVSMSKATSMLPPSSSLVKESTSTSTVEPSVTTSTVKSMSTSKMNPFTTAVISSSITSTSSMQPQTTSTSLSIRSSTIVASSTVLVPTTTTMAVTSSTPVVVTTSSSMMTIVTSSTNSDDKPTTSEDKAEFTTSITEAPTTFSSSSTEMSMSFDPGPMNTMDMDMDMSSTPTPTNSARRRRDVFKRQAPVSGSFIHLSIQTSCGAGAPVVNPYGASLTCSPDNQLACPVGDLTGKHGVLSERSLLTDLNLPLTGPNAGESFCFHCKLNTYVNTVRFLSCVMYFLSIVSGSGLAVRVGDANMSPIVCMPLPAAVVTPDSVTTPSVTSTPPIGGTPAPGDSGT